MNLKVKAPADLTEDAKRSGLLQCPQCGLIWFGRTDDEKFWFCPEGDHGTPVHVALLCRTCDAVLNIADYTRHVEEPFHRK